METDASSDARRGLSGVIILAEWANGVDAWARAVVRELLATRAPLSEVAIDAAYQRFLVEKDLAPGEKDPVPSLAIEAGAVEQIAPLRLLALTDVEHVNALAARQRIDFNPRLTVLYGENASGKSGYVRILKALAHVRTEEPILDNVRAAGGAAAQPSATVTCALGDTEESLGWRGESGVPPYTRMSVFDARAVSLHVDDDLSYVYTPRDLALFRDAHQAFDAIKARLDAAVKAAAPSSNPFLARFTRGIAIYAAVETLGAATDLQALERLAVIPAEEERELQPLRERVDALQSRDLPSRIQVARTRCSVYQLIKETASQLAAADYAGYNAAVAGLAQAMQEHRAVTERVFADAGIPGGLSTEWRAFIEAGDAYLAALGEQAYPSDESVCIYCRQPLTDAALTLVRKYRALCMGKARTALDAATAKLADARRAVLEPRVAALNEALTRDPSTIEYDAAFIVQVEQLIATATDLRVAAEAREPLDTGAVTALATTVERGAAQCLATATQAIEALSLQEGERQAELKREIVRLQELDARLTLRSLLPEIVQHVERARWADRAGMLLSSRFPPLLKSLTDAAKRASEQLLNQDFEARFREEARVLRAPEVKLHFPGRRGEPARRKVLTEGHKLSEILSEGEQKVIALADFLAEVSLRRTAAPIIFDDPVCSLDHRRIHEVVSRIAGLSDRHQVVVFTHNIWFTAELLAVYEARTADCSYYDIGDQDGAVGVVSRGTHPRWDTPKHLADRIERHIQEAERTTGETQAALIEKAYDYLRSWCEVVVEQDLLKGVTRRYEPNVRMGQLRQIQVERLQDAIDTLLLGFDKACRIMGGHSQPLATLSVRPSITDLKDDWAALIAARTKYSAN